MKAPLIVAAICGAMVFGGIVLALGWPPRESTLMSLPESGIELRTRLTTFGDGAIVCLRNGRPIGRIPYAPAEFGERVGSVVWSDGGGLSVTILNYRGTGHSREFTVRPGLSPRSRE